MISLLLSEAKRLHQRLADGDPEARKFFLEAFHATALCWLCDEPIGPDGTNVTVQDPANPRMALIMPECISADVACTVSLLSLLGIIELE